MYGIRDKLGTVPSVTVLPLQQSPSTTPRIVWQGSAKENSQGRCSWSILALALRSRPLAERFFRTATLQPAPPEPGNSLPCPGSDVSQCQHIRAG